MRQILKNDWNELLKDEFSKDYYLSLREFLKNEYTTKIIYPDKYDIFNALHYTSYKDVKVVRDAKKAITLCHKSVYPEYF